MQQEIDNLDAEQIEESENIEDENLNFDIENSNDGSESINDFATEQTNSEPELQSNETETVSELPNMNDLGMDFADSTQF